MFCRNCGQQLDDDAQFCTNCGIKVSQVPSDAKHLNESQMGIVEPKEKNIRTNKLVPIMVGATLFVVVGIGIIMAVTLLNKPSKNNPNLELAASETTEPTVTPNSTASSTPIPTADPTTLPTPSIEEKETPMPTTEVVNGFKPGDPGTTAFNRFNDDNVIGYTDYNPNRQYRDFELAVLSDYQLKVLRNEIYARHGFKFQTPAMKEQFSQFDWYVPSKDNVPDSELTAAERANVELIKKLEASQSARGAAMADMCINTISLYISSFEMQDGYLVATADKWEGIKDGSEVPGVSTDKRVFKFKVADDCLWLDMSVGSFKESGIITFNDVKNTIDELRAKYVNENHFNSPAGITLYVKGDKVVKVTRTWS